MLRRMWKFELHIVESVHIGIASIVLHCSNVSQEYSMKALILRPSIIIVKVNVVYDMEFWFFNLRN